MDEVMRKYHRDWYHANKETVGPKKLFRERKRRKFSGLYRMKLR